MNIKKAVNKRFLKARKTKKAFTLIEVLFAAFIASMLFYVISSTFSTSVRQFSTNQTHLEAISITQTVLDIVESTVNRHLVSDDNGDSFLLPEGPSSDLTIFASEASSNGVYKGVPHTFSLEPSADGEFFYFVHNDKVHRNLSLSGLEFEVLEAESIAGAKPLYFLEITVTGTTPVKEGLPQKKEFTLKGLVALTAQTALLQNPQWNPNPYIYKHF